MRILLVIAYLISLTCNAQVRPSWINARERALKYSETSYFTGFSSQYFDEDDDLNNVVGRVKGLARAALCEYIQVKVNSNAKSDLQNLNGMAFENYTKSIVTTSSISTSGLKVESYVDSRKRVVYALAFVSRMDLIDSYTKSYDAGIANLEQLLQSARNAKDKGVSYARYLDVISKLEKLKNTIDILSTIGASRDTEDWQSYLSEAKSQLDLLKSANDISLKEGARFFASRLMKSIDNQSIPVSVNSISFRNTTMGSEFSERLTLLLMQFLMDEGIKVIEKSNFNRNYLSLDGSYWPGENQIQLSGQLKKMNGDEVVEILSGATVFVDKRSVMEEGIELAPSSPEKTVAINQIIAKGKQPDLGMHVEMWTNKNGESQLFKEGDRLKISIRVNQPSYIRLINVWNDGSVLLLLDNEFITSAESNKIIDLGQEFETQCPCGVEYLQIVSSTDRFEDLDTYEENGFLFVKNPLEDVVLKSRKREDADHHFSEQIITVTTLPK